MEIPGMRFRFISTHMGVSPKFSAEWLKGKCSKSASQRHLIRVQNFFPRACSLAKEDARVALPREVLPRTVGVKNRLRLFDNIFFFFLLVTARNETQGLPRTITSFIRRILFLCSESSSFFQLCVFNYRLCAIVAHRLFLPRNMRNNYLSFLLAHCHIVLTRRTKRCHRL